MSKSTQALIKKKWKASDIEDQTGKIMIITGANSGLGFYASKELARKGATVVMTARNPEKGKEAIEELKAEIPDAKVELMQLDLASLKSVKEFTDTFKTKYDKLDVLMNNAGIMQPPKRETEEGFELQIGVNHMAHFVLTHYLFDLLKKTPGSRVVNQSSIAATMGNMNFDDLHSKKKYSRTDAYGQSKLANLLFTFEMDRKLKDSNIDSVKSIACHPGYTATNLQSNGPSVGGKSFLSRLYKITNFVMAQNVKMGILPMLYAMTASDVESGDYIGPKKLGGSRGYPKRLKAVDKAYHEEDGERLWEITEKDTGITFNF